MLSLLLKNSLIPIKWTAAENLRINRFTIKLDIRTYGDLVHVVL